MAAGSDEKAKNGYIAKLFYSCAAAAQEHEALEKAKNSYITEP